MANRKLCIGTSAEFEVSTQEQIRLIKEAGFDGFFTAWTPDEPIAEYRRIGDEVGLMYQSIHAPYRKLMHMWAENADAVIAELKACVEACAQNGVPIMVMHSFKGFVEGVKYNPPSKIGLDNYRQVIDLAGKLGVIVAFENTEGEEYLAALMNEFKNCAHVRFCLDTGHEQCYNHGKDMLSLYGERLVCTHINDNLGISDPAGSITPTDDLHLLPFDGIVDWPGLVKRFKDHGYEGPLTFELRKKSKKNRHENDKYTVMPIREYLASAYNRALWLDSMME